MSSSIYSTYIPPDIETEPTRAPVRKRPHRTARTGEIWGQCASCLDFFSLYVYESHGRILIGETPRLKWVVSKRGETPHLVHLHPFSTLLGGKVHLYGSLERFFGGTSPAGDQLRCAVSAPASF